MAETVSPPNWKGGDIRGMFGYEIPEFVGKLTWQTWTDYLSDTSYVGFIWYTGEGVKRQRHTWAYSGDDVDEMMKGLLTVMRMER